MPLPKENKKQLKHENNSTTNQTQKQNKHKKKADKKHCDKKCRHAEYYDMQGTFDELYEKGTNNGVFTNLMPLVTRRENILLAYRNIRANKGSMTAGTDGLTIKDVEKLTPEEVVDKVRYILTNRAHGYRPKPVRRVEIPKEYDPSKTRPLGIPCIWDRLVQQCIKQVLEPICEAHFSNNSYGFRPNRSVENAISVVYHKLNLSSQHYVVEFDIKSFFDCVDHSKLVRQIWSLGIQDRTLLYIIRQMLKAPIVLPNGEMIYPGKGTPQGGIISPLLANICLNELDQWVSKQWETHPIVTQYGDGRRSQAYKYMRRNTNLKEMYIIRYADDFRIFCKDKVTAGKIKEAVTTWLAERLHLEVSPEKTKVTNLRKQYMNFLGFKIKVHQKRKKWVVFSHICDKKLAKMEAKLVDKAKDIARPRRHDGKLREEISLYNSMVMGEQNYYHIATEISSDTSVVNRRVMTVFTNRLGTRSRHARLLKAGRRLTATEQARYGKSKMLRFEGITHEPIYPIGYVKFHFPYMLGHEVTCYSAHGRQKIHDNLQINTSLMLDLMRSPPPGANIRIADACISKFSAQWGKCGVTKEEFQNRGDICCHYIIPLDKGGKMAYSNIVLVKPDVHRLLISTDAEDINRLLASMKLSGEDLGRLNKYRTKAGLQALTL